MVVPESGTESRRGIDRKLTGVKNKLLPPVPSLSEMSPIGPPKKLGAGDQRLKVGQVFHGLPGASGGPRRPR